MTPWTAQRLGAVVGAVLAITWVIWMRTRATPCPGAVTNEFHPPLADPGTYHFKLSWGDQSPCEFAVSLPLPLSGGAKAANKRGCRMALELRTQVQNGVASIAGLRFAAAPERFHLRVTRDDEALYDTEVEPQYAPYATIRAEDPHFCGERARVLPACLRGSSECAPFPATCDGPPACAPRAACCLTPEWGRDYGPKAASECSSAISCLSHFGHLACHADADCPPDMRCGDASLAADFSRPVLVCQNR